MRHIEKMEHSADYALGYEYGASEADAELAQLRSEVERLNQINDQIEAIGSECANMIHDAALADGPWIAEIMVSRWQSTMIGGHGALIDTAGLPALIAGDRAGLATYRVLGEDAELISIDALPPGRGTGTALIEALVKRLEPGCKRLWVTTTNDNLSALRFYQRRGFRLIKIWPGAVDVARKSIKPTISQIGQYGIPIHDEIDLCRMLDDSDVVTLRPPWAIRSLTDD